MKWRRGVSLAGIYTITEEECIEYAYNLVLRRTYDGYRTEIETIYGQLESAVGLKIEPAPDNWDRTYSVDFFIKSLLAFKLSQLLLYKH